MSTLDDITPHSAPLRLFRFASASGQSMLACLLVGVMLGLGLIALAGYLTDTAITAYDPVKMNDAARMLAPSAAHWRGTDKIGRDMLAHFVAGSWISLALSLAGSLAGWRMRR